MDYRRKGLGGELAEMLKTATAETLKTLLDMRDKESRRLATLAVKLRLTQQSRYTPQAAATAAKAPSASKAWQFGT